MQRTGIDFKESKSAEREGLIERGEVDYIVATYSITDTRKEKVNFAGPYFVAHQDLLVKADNTDITGPDAMNGKILCSVTGSTSAQKVKDNYAADVALQEYGTYSECVEALQSGAVDAVTTDDVILAGYAAQYPGELKVVGKGFSTENYGIGLMKGDDRRHRRDQRRDRGDDRRRQLGRRRWTTTVGPSGYTIPAPPTPAADRHGPVGPGPIGGRPVRSALRPAPTPSATSRRSDPARRSTSLRARGGSRELQFSVRPEYDILGAFWMTVQLTFWSAIGSFILGTILAAMRVSPGAADAGVRRRFTSTSSATFR